MPQGTDYAADLALADLHIAEAEERIGRQGDLAARMAAAGGRDPAGAEELLRQLTWSLDLMREHRRLILAELDRDG